MMSRVVIYTCVVGGYDSLSVPVPVSGDFDYICFHKKGETLPVDGVWQHRELPYDDPDSTRLARRAKHCPWEILPDYGYSVWIDGNLDITGQGFYDSITEAIKAGTVYGMLRHPLRDDSYDELWRCFANDRIGLLEALRVRRMLLAHGIEPHGGMIETNVLLRKHNDPSVLGMDRMWWSLICGYSLRDQLSVMVSLKESGVPCSILWDGRSTRDFPYVKYRVHRSAPRKDSFIRKFRRETGKIILSLLKCRR